MRVCAWQVPGAPPVKARDARAGRFQAAIDQHLRKINFRVCRLRKEREEQDYDLRLKNSLQLVPVPARRRAARVRAAPARR